MKILIVLNQNVELARLPLHDFVIGVDGGCRYCMDHDLAIDLAIGDFDSLAESDYNRLDQQAKSIQRHSPEKDHSDLELAICHAMTLKPGSMTICGVWGGRADHCLANILCLSTQTGSVPVTMPGLDQNGYLLKQGQSINFESDEGNVVSLIALTESCTGITAQGLKYPLDEDHLKFGTGRGLSNEITKQQARIYLGRGVLLILVDVGIRARIETSNEEQA